jgi:hypothetical protein
MEQKPNEQRREAAGNEILRLMIEQSHRTDAELRSRISALSSVVFGLSLLALQVNEPRSGVVVLVAWIFLGSAVVLSIASAFLANKVSSDASGQSIEYWVGRQNEPPEAPTGHRTEVWIVRFSGICLTVGVVLLIVFASQNLV